ncbi:metallophosphoesterase [Maritimibacter sp. 55A14]|uniref:metallophosphoesterase family protein n=1 Tax=Maritimibacter sp. 55A14 TaxID=2174844 RepID=UPI001E4FAE30|nr:metallophosphoesterase [Maritimibacter sp. 55A14]
MGIPPARRICTGDVVAYGADGPGCVALIRQSGGAVLAGNCEIQLAADAADCGCGYGQGSACAVLARDSYAHARAGLDAAARGWMAGLPRRIVFTHAGRRYAVLHGGASDVSRFIWPDTGDDVFEHEIRLLQAGIGAVDGVVAGHCGIAFRRRVAGIDWINAGVIGLPPHDGHRATRFAVLDGDAPRIERLDYDAEAAAAEMCAAGLTQGYDAALLSGWWPSEDTLPPGLRRYVD